MTRISCLLLLLAVGLAGCERKAPNAAHEPVSLFEEGKGILLSDQTTQLFGLEFVTVTEKSLKRRTEKMARVYRPAGEHTVAAATLVLAPEEATHWNVGQPASIKALRQDCPEICGTLAAFDRQAETVIGQVEGLIEFPDPNRRFAIGDPVSVTLTNSESRRALVVPESALLTTAEGTFLYVVNAGHLTRTRVKTGTVADGIAEIEDGVSAGASVVTKGLSPLWLVELSALKAGTPCCPVPDK